MCEAKDVPVGVSGMVGKIARVLDGAETEGQDALMRIPAEPIL